MYMWISHTLDFWLQFGEKKVRLIHGRLQNTKGSENDVHSIKILGALHFTVVWYILKAILAILCTVENFFCIIQCVFHIINAFSAFYSPKFPAQIVIFTAPCQVA